MCWLGRWREQRDPVSGLSAGILLTDGVDCEPDHRFDRSLDVVERGHVGNPAKLGLGSDHEVEGCRVRFNACCDRSEDRDGDHPVSAKSRFDGVAVQDDRFQAIGHGMTIMDYCRMVGLTVAGLHEVRPDHESRRIG